MRTGVVFIYDLLPTLAIRIRAPGAGPARKLVGIDLQRVRIGQCRARVRDGSALRNSVANARKRAFDRAYGSRRRVGCVVGAIANHKGSMVTARRGHRIGRWRPARHRFPLNARERGCITTGLGLRKF